MFTLIMKKYTFEVIVVGCLALGLFAIAENKEVLQTIATLLLFLGYLYPIYISVCGKESSTARRITENDGVIFVITTLASSILVFLTFGIWGIGLFILYLILIMYMNNYFRNSPTEKKGEAM